MFHPVLWFISIQVMVGLYVCFMGGVENGILQGHAKDVLGREVCKMERIQVWKMECFQGHVTDF